MLKIKNEYLNKEFIDALNYLSEKEVGIQVAVKLEKILEKLQIFLIEKNKEEASLIDKFAMKDEEGKFILAKGEDGSEIPNSYNISKEDVEDYKNEYKSFIEKEHEIDIDKIHMSELNDVKISTTKFSYLKPLFHL